MQTIAEIRRKNLWRLKDEFGGWAELSRRCGKNERDATFSQIWNRAPDSKTGTPKKMGDKLARRLEKALELPNGWMDSDHSSADLGLGDTDVDATVVSELPEDGIPVVGEAKLGDQGFYDEMQYPVGHGDAWIRYPTRDKNAYALRCKGDSMQPRVRNGEFVVLEPSRTAVAGEMVCVKTKDGRTMIKNLGSQADGSTEVLSVNHDHKPITVPSDDIEFIHVVVNIAMRYSYVEAG